MFSPSAERETREGREMYVVSIRTTSSQRRRLFPIHKKSVRLLLLSFFCTRVKLGTQECASRMWRWSETHRRQTTKKHINILHAYCGQRECREYFCQQQKEITFQFQLVDHSKTKKKVLKFLLFALCFFASFVFAPVALTALAGLQSTDERSQQSSVCCCFFSPLYDEHT